MDGTHAQRSIDALIDDVDAAFLTAASPQVPPPLQRIDRARSAPVRAATAQPRRADDSQTVVVQTSKRAIVFSMLIGFVAGAVCWHLLGFWWFVSDVMFHRRGEPTAQISRPAAIALKAQSRQSGVAGPILTANLDHCSSAVRDGLTGDTLVGVCDVVVVRFRPARGLGKADLGDFGPSPVPTLISGTSPQEPAFAISPAGSAAVGGWLARVEKTQTPGPSN